MKAGRVVYVAAEGGGGFRNRLKAYAQQHQVDLAGVPFGVVHAAPNLLLKPDALELAKAIKASGGADVVVVDTWAQATPGGNENSAEDMGRALAHCRGIHIATGAVVVLVHHAGKDTSKGARGWSGLRAAADAELEVQRLPAGRVLKVTKQKDGDDSGAWGFELEAIAVGVDSDGDEITSCVVAEAPVPEVQVSQGKGRPAASGKGLDYLRKFDGDVKGLDADYADQIHAVLERYDLRRATSLREIGRRKSLVDWVESQREQGFEPDLPPGMLDEARRQSYKELTVEEFRGLVDGVRQIEHLGRLKNKLLTAADQREYEAARDEITASIREHAGDRHANTRTATTALGEALQKLKQFGAAHIKAATWARIMDGGKDGGPLWEYLVRPANERANQEATMRAEATEALARILKPLTDAPRRSQFFPSINRSLTMQERFAIALNLGNEGNAQRLLGGEGWTMQQLQPVLQSLTAGQWQAVQAVWDHFESYRPAIAAKERRVYGKEPAWVEPRAFEVATADGSTVALRGGYYPIKYDPAASQRAEEHADAEDAKRQMQGAYTSATTRRSFTKTRAEEVNGRPLLYSLAGVYSGVNDVIHDLAWHEWLIDANRLLRSKSIDTEIRQRYGPEAKAQLKSWVRDIAEGGAGTNQAGEIALGRLRRGVSMAGLGFNVVSAAMQPLGITQSMVRVGTPWVARGIAQYIAGPISAARRVNEMSAFMANRNRTRFRELNELRNQVQGQNVVQDVAGRYGYWLMMRFQQMVDVPTWLGAYEKAISQGNDEARARDLADQAVIDSQGGGEVKDLSAIERGGPALKLFTVFYSFMNTALNLGVAQGATAQRTAAGRAKLAADMLLLYTVPAVLGSLLKDALTPGDGGDDDWEKLARKLAAEQLGYLMGLFVVAREFQDVGKIVTGAEGARDYAGPAGTRMVGDAMKFGKQAMQGEFDDAFRKATINLVGDLLGLPAAQANRTITGVQALAEGKTENPAAIAFGFQQKK